MPELPEVETLRIQLSHLVLERELSELFIISNKLRYPLTEELFIFVGKKLQAVKRRSRNLLLDFGLINKFMLINCGMTGSLVVRKDLQPQKHDCARFTFGDTYIFYNDIRRFGYILNFDPNDPRLTTIGPEPLGDQFNYDYLKNLCAKSSTPIKPMLMDSKVVAGIGNIYSSEILFEAGIYPLKIGRELTENEIRRLFTAINKVLTRAIEARGTTFSNYRNLYNLKGNFQQELMVYMVKNCKHCSGIITKIKCAGRSTFFCPSCQNL